jgi:hypothetical protein
LKLFPFSFCHPDFPNFQHEGAKFVHAILPISGDAQSQLDGMKIFLDELANYIQCSSIESLDKEKSLHQMLISFKNSMTDRHSPKIKCIPQ